MKQKTLTNPRLWIPVLAVAFTICLVSWGQKQTPGDQRQQYKAADTTPKKKTDKKVRDLDDVMYELDMTDFKLEMEKMQQELSKAMKEFDGQKIKLDIEKAMKDIDFSKIQKEVQESLAKVDWDKMKAEVDFDKIQKEVKESMEKIDWNEMKKELDEVKNIDMKKLDEEMKKMKEELEKIGPQIKEEMEKAKVEMEKAKTEIKEYKDFVDGLEKDGLLNKKENYTIKHKDGELTVNGKKVSEQTYSKYRNFLEKHKKFSIEKDNDDFDIDMD